VRKFKFILVVLLAFSAKVAYAGEINTAPGRVPENNALNAKGWVV
jgi:hypothetical protein